MKKIDLNMLEVTHNNSINFQDLKADELVKNKMRKRHELVEEHSQWIWQWMMKFKYLMFEFE